MSSKHKKHYKNIKLLNLYRNRISQKSKEIRGYIQEGHVPKLANSNYE